MLRRVHAAVVLAGRPGLVKAFPHSLLEALAAGRPVLVSEGNPMAEYVRETGCGRVVPRLAAADLLEAIRLLRLDYATCRARAVDVGQRDFSQERWSRPTGSSTRRSRVDLLDAGVREAVLDATDSRPGASHWAPARSGRSSVSGIATWARPETWVTPKMGYEVTGLEWTVPAVNRQLRQWERIYNTIRPCHALGYRTPREFLETLARAV